MNERLEKEWQQISSIQQLVEGKAIWTEEQVKELCNHFYNLALEDVKNEVEKEKMNNVKDFSNGCDEDQCYGFDLALKHIEVFIDQLNK